MYTLAAPSEWYSCPAEMTNPEPQSMCEQSHAPWIAGVEGSVLGNANHENHLPQRSDLVRNVSERHIGGEASGVKVFSR